jgi:hypothetical protein
MCDDREILATNLVAFIRANASNGERKRMSRTAGISVAKRRETTVQERTALKLVVAMAGAILAVAAIIPSSGIRPYGEQALRAQIDIDNV